MERYSTRRCHDKMPHPWIVTYQLDTSKEDVANLLLPLSNRVPEAYTSTSSPHQDRVSV